MMTRIIVFQTCRPDQFVPLERMESIYVQVPVNATTLRPVQDEDLQRAQLRDEETICVT
jgi:hypothetical protein